MINVKVEIPKGLPIEELNQYVDDVVFNAARMTLDLTNSKQHFPYLTGKLNRAAMAEGIRTLGNRTYGLGADGVEYAPAVWKYPQKGTNWTNPETYAQWYITEFKNDKELIMTRAIESAKKGHRI